MSYEPIEGNVLVKVPITATIRLIGTSKMKISVEYNWTCFYPTEREEELNRIKAKKENWEALM